MDFNTAVKHEDNDKPVMMDGQKFYVVGHNELNGTVKVRELSSNPLFTVPKDVNPEKLEEC
ncbi:hypothetical protein L2520_03770 [Limosilactobacillus vaginalis]|uniref:Uncharacterized protein n=1 Tax=Limosilactobacillus vaginalis TaxID=1633 RepID=A0ABT4K6M8_9LACO|nr:hypothetical protein [Limosilactobacillus vaginalis]MCZ3746541.1 hypothetical protein [Limosilactobacillus vaginalis]MCZ3751567.1 hypothetical protein [Limosilactobacillus vaginalis]MCZ3753253.1 hypothetical protein [Limosilactobacillus vaginalis]MCZ3755061.1 hypothetical protein [Limosilactobacillus vaginalis]MCZ3756739.1 hypothetical protein [Limosilactobacillus vaginalis]